MELYLFWNSDYERLYNCTFYNIERIPLEKRIHPVIGSIFILLFLFFEIMYIPTLYVMRQRSFLIQSCYKLMYCMGIADVFCMFVNGLFTGYFAVLGYVFCSCPTLIYWLGIMGTGIWVFQSDLGMILAMNRCLGVYRPEWCKALFKGPRTFLWVAVVSVHAFLFVFHFKPVVYTSLHVSWFFNPHTGYFEDFGIIYYNVAHSIHNIMVVVVLSSCYFVFMIMMVRKSFLLSDGNSSRISTSEKQSFLQVFIICMINAVAASIYIYMQFFAVPEGVILLAQFCWLCAHGCPSLIYLSLNKSIQSRLSGIFSRESRVSATTNSSTFNANAGNK